MEKVTRLLLLECIQLLQRPRQPSIIAQEIQHLAEAQLPRGAYLHEALVGRRNLGDLLGRQGDGQVWECLVRISMLVKDDLVVAV